MTRIFIVLTAVSVAAAQAPVVGEIDFYGLHKVTSERILNALNVKSGDSLPPSKGDLEEILEKLPGVVLGRVEAVCCEGPSASLFIGIEERGAPHASFRSAPDGDAVLPEELRNSYRRYVRAVQKAARQGETAEDLTAGHPIMSDPEARVFTAEFISFAGSHLEQLREVLRNAADPDQRAIAAAVIDYSSRKKAIVDDLQYAMQDPEESVRANAMRSLTAISVLSGKHPELGIKVSPTWFIEMLNSIVLGDRVEATRALLTLTDRANAAALQQIRERGLASLAEMARWKMPRYALPPFLLVGRVAGLEDAQVHRSWEKGDRETVIARALESPARKR